MHIQISRSQLQKKTKMLQQILFSPVFYTGFFVLLLPLVDSSQENVTSNHGSSNNSNVHQLSPRLLYEISIHGFLLWASMGFLMPIGILIIRMSQREECGKKLKILFYLHLISQIVSVLLITAGAIMSIRNFNNLFNNHHQRIGLALYAMVWLQSLVGFIRPQRGSRRRSVWFSLHWVLGSVVCALGILNIYTGLAAYHEKTRRSTEHWTLLFTIQVLTIVFFYLFQDKWPYIRNQALTHPPILPNKNQINTTC